MSSLPEPIKIPVEILHEIYVHAREAFPAEACGWLEGSKDGIEVSKVHRCINVQSQGIHPTEAERGEERAYVFSPEDLIAFAHGMDAAFPPRIIYHSHTNGKSYLSNVDIENATDPWNDGKMYDVQQLVIGVDGIHVVEAILFDWSEDTRCFQEIQHYQGN